MFSFLQYSQYWLAVGGRFRGAQDGGDAACVNNCGRLHKVSSRKVTPSSLGPPSHPRRTGAKLLTGILLHFFLFVDFLREQLARVCGVESERSGRSLFFSFFLYKQPTLLGKLHL
jgi:hypothetical protein